MNMRMTLQFHSPPDQTLRFSLRCSWNIFEDGDLKSMLALIAPTKNPRQKFNFVHDRIGLTKIKKLSMTLIWTT